jgi:RNA polymerase sigma-70 factor (ECF subfamily)
MMRERGARKATVMEHAAVESDRDLVAKAKSGDFAAFEQLVSRYERRVFRAAARIVGRREDAEDVVQDTFTSVIEHLAGFREESGFYTWLMRIAVNHALKRLRKRRRWLNVSDGSPQAEETYGEIPHPEFIAPWRDNPALVAERHEVQKLLGEALIELDEKYRTVFVLRDMEERTTAEVAEILGISESNVKVRLLRARLQLRERITRTLGDESRRLVADHYEHD